jgi:serine/threonine-protein kinase
MTVHEPEALVGAVIAERYRVLGLIGSGSMGTVYEVEQVGSGQRAAMKTLGPEVAESRELGARLLREAKAMSLFEHRNIVELLDVVWVGTAVFVVTELVRGVSLRAVMEDGQVEPRRALAIVRQVLEALDHAHARGVVHRDVKPENIMLADGGHPERADDLVKVLDFGVAKLLDDTRALLGEGKLTRTDHEVFGSPYYVAPEPVLGRPVDARTDLYSVGVVLFELLAGRPPFDAPDPLVLLRMHATAQAPTLRERAPERAFTPELEYVVAEALAKKPELRFASAVDMIAAVDAAARSLDAPTLESLAVPSLVAPPAVPLPGVAPLPAAPPSSSFPRERAVSARTQRRALWALGGTIAAVIVIASIAALATGDGAPRKGSPGAGAASARDAGSFVTEADESTRRGRHLAALGAIERAILLEPALARDPQIRARIAKVLETRDVAAAMIALELLASRVDPPARDEIVAKASAAPVREIRWRALAIAERDGYGEQVDRLGSWSKDLRQVTTCDDRRGVILKLRELGDPRAIAALRRARGEFACIARDAADAITHLQSQPQPQPQP